MIECKETEGNTIPRSKLLRDESVHQYEALIQWQRYYPQNIAGYLCHLGEPTLVVWVPVLALKGTNSINPGLIGSLGVRAIDLSSSRVDWQYLFLGGDDASTESSRSQDAIKQKNLHDSVQELQETALEDISQRKLWE